MGRILLTNNANWSNTLCSWFSNVGFNEFGHIEVSGLFLSVYEKLNIKTYNLYCSGNNCVGCAGTFIYNGKLGKDALMELLEEAKNGFDLNNIRSKALGSYVVVIKLEDMVYVFVDQYHTYSIYYYMDKKDYIITNNFSHVESIVHQPINPCRTIEYISQFNIVGNQTPYNNIYKLMGNEYFSLDLNSKKWGLKHTKEPKIITKLYSSIEQACDDLCQIIRDYSNIKARLFKSPHLFITGGCDSRLMLASYLSVGVRPNLVRWHGADSILNSRVEDYIASKELAKQTHLAFKNYYVKEDFCNRLKNITNADVYKYGDLMFKYGDNDKWHKIYTKLKADFLDYGYFGETLVDWDKMDNTLDFTKKVYLCDFVSQLYINHKAVNNWKYTEEYNNIIFDEYREIAENQNIDCNNLSPEDCMLLFFYYRLHADTHMVNFSNMYSYYFPLLCQPGIIEKIHNIPYAFKQNHKLSLQMIQVLYGPLLNIVFFSHCRYRETDVQNLELHEANVCTKKIYFLRRLMLKLRFDRFYHTRNRRIKRCCIKKSQTFAKRILYQFDKTRFVNLPLYTTFALFGKMDFIINKEKYNG